MFMKKILFISFLSIFINIFLISKLSAQQDLMLTQYMTTLQPTNPAYVGTTGHLNATAISRDQWVGFEGAPKSQLLIINSPFIKNNIGVGGMVVRDKVGPVVQTSMFIDFAYNFNITEKVKLSMGLKSGLNIQNPDLSELNVLDQNDPSFDYTNNIELLPNFGFGMYLYSEKYYLGVSTPELIKNSYDGISNALVEGGEERHYFFIGGTVFDIGSSWKMKPSFITKVVKGAPLSVDLTTSMIYNDKLWLGAMYRFGDAVGVIVQYQINNQFRFGYSYDFSTSGMRGHNYGTHEIMLSYDMVFKDEKIVTPRYF